MPHYWLCTIVQSVYNRWKSGLSQIFGWDPIVTIVPDCTWLRLDFGPSIHVQSETIHDNPLQSWFNPGLYMLSSIVTRLNEFFNQTPIHTIKRQSGNNPKKTKNKKQKKTAYETSNLSILLQSDSNPDWIIWQSSSNPLSIKDRHSYTGPYNPETILQNRGNKKKFWLYTIGLTIEWQSCTNPVEVHRGHRGAQGAQGGPMLLQSTSIVDNFYNPFGQTPILSQSKSIVAWLNHSAWQSCSNRAPIKCTGAQTQVGVGI